jgi:hypothetical protein
MWGGESRHRGSCGKTYFGKIPQIFVISDGFNFKDFSASNRIDSQKITLI